MWITNLFVDRPCTVLLSGIFFLFLVTVLSGALGYFEVMPSNNREYLVWTDQKVKDWDMLNAAKEAIQEAKASDKPMTERIQNTLKWNPAILVSSPSGNENLL